MRGGTLVYESTSEKIDDVGLDIRLQIVLRLELAAILYSLSMPTILKR